MRSGTINGSTFLKAMGVQFQLLENGVVSAVFTLGPSQEGPPGFAHGGVLAALIDEAMGAACWFAGNRSVSVHLAFDYKQAAPIGAEIRIAGQVERHEGRKVFTSGSITLADGRLAVSGNGIFVDAPLLLEKTPGFSLIPTPEK